MDGFKSQMKITEGKLSELEHKAIKIISYEAHRGKKVVVFLRVSEPVDTIKWSDTCIIGVPEGPERRRMEQKKKIDEISSNLIKNINFKIQDAQ